MSLNQLRAKMLARKKAAAGEQAAAKSAPTASSIPPHPSQPTKVAEAVAGQLSKSQVTVADFNPEQKMSITLARAGKSFCLIGGAGSGKTTTTKGIAQELYDSGQIGKLTGSTEKLFSVGAPSVAVLSFTNQAVRNIASALPHEFKRQCSTFHNAVEYHPDYFEIEVMEDGVWTGDYKNSMRFIPRYGMEGSKVDSVADAAAAEAHSQVEWFVEKGDGMGKGEILPHLDVVIVEEAGSVPRDLFYTFMSALPRPKDTVFVFLGDLNQIPPVFDDAILGFMLLALPVIELSTLYRNVGLVTKVAQRILTGKAIRDVEATKDYKDGGLSGTDDSGTVLFKPFKQHVPWEIATPSLGRHLQQMVIEGQWDENTSVVLIPQNVKLGQVELNKWVGQGIATRDNLEIHHVTFNGQNRYFCIGDKVMYNKRYHRIVEINPNNAYKGKKPLPPSTKINRWGTIQREFEAELLGGMTCDEYNKSVDIDAFLDSYTGEELATTQQASSIITMVKDKTELEDDELAILERNPNFRFGECEAKGAGDVTNILPVNVMTVHKAQGSEWQNVLCIFHRSHGMMLNRELVYTAITRARTNLTVWYSGEDKRETGASALCRGIINQAIKGQTLEAKLDYFRNKLKVEAVKNELAAQKQELQEIY